MPRRSPGTGRASGAQERLIQLGSGSSQDAENHALLAPGRPRRRRKVSTAVSPLLALTEAQFQRIVRAELARRGFVVWVFPIMKRTMAGVPDLTFWHPGQPGRLYAWELKRESGRVRPEQAVALAHLATVPGVDARIVRPSDWEGLRDGLLEEV